MRSAVGIHVPLREALSRALVELREPCLQRLISAGASPADAERLMGNVIEELVRTESRMVRPPDFEKRFLRAVDRHCQAHADLRRLPYRTVAPVICRHWCALMERSRRVGIEREETCRILYDLIWKHGASWAASNNPEERLLADVAYGLQVISLTRRGLRLVGGNSR